MSCTLESEPERPGDGDEPRLGQSVRGAAANEVLLALGRAARSFLFYDPANAAIRQFLDALRNTSEAFASEHGDLSLEVRPFEFLIGTEVVFLDRDRERSLAFRLYRDGVRRLTIKKDATWAEVLKLLEILSIRFIGVRQAEDDLVVMLWKSGFQHVEVEAVEGFVAEENEDDEEDDEEDEDDDAGADAADAVMDVPLDELYARAPVRFEALSPDVIEGLLAEDGIAAIPDLCMQLAHELLSLVEDPEDPLTLQEALPQLRDLRDFVQTDGQLDVVLEMARRIAGASLCPKPGCADPTPEREALLASFVDERSLTRLVRGTANPRSEVPQPLVSLLQLVPGSHVGALLGVLANETNAASTRVARALVERYARDNADRIVEQVQFASPNVAVELLRALRYGHPDKGLEAARQYALRSAVDRNVDVELGCLRILNGGAITPTVARVLTVLLGSAHPEARAAALGVVARRRVQDAFHAVLDRVKRDGLGGLSPDEADAYGEALAGADPDLALGVFRDWIKPKGFFAAMVPPMLRWVAVSGLVNIIGPEAEDLIKVASEKGGAELARHCTDCMVRRRRTARTSSAPGLATRKL